tara:strand:- start:3094 stop:3537 length:444 start_codon:yes stop_codon:yes gene_type:complete
MTDISGVGIQIQLVANTTFPAGFTVSEFADDADPLDMASIKLADVAMGLNGDLISWGKAVALPMVINVIPDGDDDINLAVLAESNRIGRGKRSAKDQITAIVTYPDGRTIVLARGVLTDASIGTSVASAGRKKTKSYAFSFENKAGA